MASTAGVGDDAVRYGTMRENVLGATVVLADGRVIRTGSRARKSAAGYDLTRLFVGSEGTLGVITELTVRLYPQLDGVSAAVCAFPSITRRSTSVIEAHPDRHPDRADRTARRDDGHAINRYSELGLRECPRSCTSCTVRGPAPRTGGGDAGDRRANTAARTSSGRTTEDAARLWEARHNAYFAVPGHAAPAAAARHRRLRADVAAGRVHRRDGGRLARSTMPIPLFGHVGDGNFHLLILVDPNAGRDRQGVRLQRPPRARARWRCDGTCTGEHGIGLGKREFLVEEFGEAVDVMRALKATLDPHDLMNPGKIV